MTETPGSRTRRSRTRAERIRSLRRRLSYLVEKREERKMSGRPYSYLTEEIEALEWAIPVLEDHRTAAARVTPSDEIKAPSTSIGICEGE